MEGSFARPVAGRKFAPGAGILWTAGLALLVACGEPRNPGTWTGTVDSLPAGGVVIRNPAVGVWDSTGAWRVEEMLRIGRAEGADGPDLFARIAALTVDPAGRIYVLESQTQEIRVFDSAGRHVRTFGRKGGGPGEFQDARGLAWDREGNLWVVDQRNNRYTVFDTTGTLRRTMPRPGTGVFRNWEGGFGPDGSFYDVGMVFERVETRADGMMASGSREVLFRLDDSAAVRDTFPLPSYEMETFTTEFTRGTTRTRMSVPVPFTGQQLWVFDPRGYVLAGITDRYRLIWLELGGDTARIVERQYDPLPVTAEETEREIERLSGFRGMEGEIDASRFGRFHWAFRGFHLDARHNLWVRVTLPADRRAENGSAFDVFDAEGRYLGLVTSDFVISAPLVIGAERLHTVTYDELDVPYVVVARIVEP